MKIYKRIIVVLAIVLSTMLIHLLDCNIPQIQIAFFNPIQQTEFVELRKYANRSVLSNELEEIEDIVIEKRIENDSIFVTVENTKRFITLDATYPIKNYETNTESNNIDIQGTVDFENAVYETKSKVYKPVVYIIVDIAVFAYAAWLIYTFLYSVPEMIIDFVRFCKKNKQEMT